MSEMSDPGPSVEQMVDALAMMYEISIVGMGEYVDVRCHSSHWLPIISRGHSASAAIRAAYETQQEEVLPCLGSLPEPQE